MLPLGRCFEWLLIVVRSSVGLDLTLLSQALAAEFDAVGIVNKAVEDGVGERRIADHVVPMIDGHLTGDDRGTLLVAIFDDLQEIAALLVVELLRPPVVEDEQVGSGERLEDLRVAAVAARECKVGELSVVRVFGTTGGVS